ncbi:hypothetical protein TSAR_006474 [Trichomalopsis sarcophagae]|uniref:Uncharacterized protein n=1 Tax=Trichomalopsis sarcophagae TaxID=543379 RepID=A0A232F9U3_9HYME|nr:hypothetical protein TSAR_006474 [Trichomalopsis sarcophagae]
MLRLKLVGLPTLPIYGGCVDSSLMSVACSSSSNLTRRSIANSFSSSRCLTRRFRLDGLESKCHLPVLGAAPAVVIAAFANCREPCCTNINRGVDLALLCYSSPACPEAINPYQGSQDKMFADVEHAVVYSLDSHVVFVMIHTSACVES